MDSDDDRVRDDAVDQAAVPGGEVMPEDEGDDVAGYMMAPPKEPTYASGEEDEVQT